MPRLRPFENLDIARFITFSCNKRLPILLDPVAARAVLKEVDLTCKMHIVNILGYVVMPEHVHLVLSPQFPFPFGGIISEVKRKSAYVISKHLQSIESPLLPLLISRRRNKTCYSIWLPQCDDHGCRKMKTVIEKINYCHYNPVKRGLVTSPELWPWSSYRFYQGMVSHPIEVDELIA